MISKKSYSFRNDMFIIKRYQLRASNYLICLECQAWIPGNVGFEEGDLCPECGKGILVSF
jgi:hypothetical protein